MCVLLVRGQRRGHDSVDLDVRRLRVRGNVSNVSDQEIIWVIPSARSSRLCAISLFEDPHDVIPQAVDSFGPPSNVAGCSPEVPPDLAAPLPHISLPVLAQIEDDVAVESRQYHAHLTVRFLKFRKGTVLPLV